MATPALVIVVMIVVVVVVVGMASEVVGS